MVISLRASLVALGLLAAPLAAGAQQVAVAVQAQGMVGPTMAPPAIIPENPSPAPGPGHTWVPGFWTWNGSQYAWNAGHWERPPQAAQTWEAPRWERDGGRYRFRAGRWAAAQGMQPTVAVVQPAVPMAVPVGQPAMPVAVPVGQPALPVMQAPPPVVTVPMAPPRPRMERRPRMIPPGQAWVPGYWSWNGSSYAWTDGHIEAPPRARAVWVAPRMERRGRANVYVPGRWR